MHQCIMGRLTKCVRYVGHRSSSTTGRSVLYGGLGVDIRNLGSPAMPAVANLFPAGERISTTTYHSLAFRRLFKHSIFERSCRDEDIEEHKHVREVHAHRRFQMAIVLFKFLPRP